MSDLLLFDPELNRAGPTLEAVLTQLIAEVGVKQQRARDRGEPLGARESAVVATKLEEALLWQYRRGQITGAVQITVHPIPVPDQEG